MVARRLWRRPVRHGGECDYCGKRRYYTWTDARVIAKSVDAAMDVYRCGDSWHVGHTVKEIRRLPGRRERDEYYQQAS